MSCKHTTRIPKGGAHSLWSLRKKKKNIKQAIQTKDLRLLSASASASLSVVSQATRRMREVDTQRQLQAEEDEERARVAFAGADRGQQQGMMRKDDEFFLFCNLLVDKLFPSFVFVRSLRWVGEAGWEKGVWFAHVIWSGVVVLLCGPDACMI